MSMLRLAVPVTLLVVRCSAFGAENWDLSCQSLSELARTIMADRQKGVSIEELMDGVDSSIEEQMVLSAFEEPRRTTPESRKRTIDDYRDLWHSLCVKAKREQKHQ